MTCAVCTRVECGAISLHWFFDMGIHMVKGENEDLIVISKVKRESIAYL